MANKSNKVIRIGGTSFSGSTMLDLMLSNADDAFSCGEVCNLFRPYRPQHFNPICVCQDSACRLWKTVKKSGEKKLWHSLFSIMPEMNIFIDSSKDMGWYRDQIKFDNKKQHEVFNVLIWKTPEEYAYSCIKRGKTDNWKRSYINYHSRYFQTMDRWVSVRYADLATQPADKLKRLCDRLGIDYFPGKEAYWDRTYHTLFGSFSAKLHLYQRDTNAYASITQERSKYKLKIDANSEPEIRQHRSIYYDENMINKLPIEIRKELDAPVFSDILKILERTELDFVDLEDDIQSAKIKVKPFFGWHVAKKFKRHIRYILCKTRMVRKSMK